MNKIKALLFLTLFIVVLCNPTQAAYYAFDGLKQWAAKIVPTLFPFMVLNSIMIYAGFDHILASILAKIMFPIFPYCTSSGLYAIFMGFFCGFPMGAKTVCDLYHQKKLSYKEATYLCGFCNNISPSFFLGLVIPMLYSLGFSTYWYFLLGMYGIPALYGIIVGYIFYFKHKIHFNKKRHGCYRENTSQTPTPVSFIPQYTFSQILRQACADNVHAILLLGGYVTFINMFRFLPNYFSCSSLTCAICGCLLEITTGIKEIYSLNLSFPILPLSVINSCKAFIILTALSFSGISCFFQAGSFLIKEGLSLSNYIRQHIIITLISSIYYYILLFHIL